MSKPDEMTEEEFLKNYDPSRYNRPSLTADMAVFAVLSKEEKTDEYRKDPEQRLGVLLVKRDGFPFRGCWALPGGFAAEGETLSDTAMRELMEETGVDSAFLEPFGVFSRPGRDPRGWIVSQAFLALVDVKKCRVRAGSDAGAAAWFEIGVSRTEQKKYVKKTSARILTKYGLCLKNEEMDLEIRATLEETKIFQDHHETVTWRIPESGGLAFDHAEILIRAFQELRGRAKDAGRIIFDLMPESFTLYSLQEAYEIVLGEKMITPNFRRKIAPFVQETGEYTSGAGHRPAMLFKRNLEAFYR